MARAYSLPSLLAACLVAGFASLLLPSTPGYDAWAWLVWGREVAELDLDTSAGPAWKPLPVLLTTLFSPLREAAPELWLGVARAGGLLELALVFRLAARLAADRQALLAGIAAALGLLLTAGFAGGVAAEAPRAS